MSLRAPSIDEPDGSSIGAETTFSYTNASGQAAIGTAASVSFAYDPVGYIVSAGRARLRATRGRHEVAGGCVVASAEREVGLAFLRRERRFRSLDSGQRVT